MLISILIGFREALEAALIIGIILAYLIKIKKEEYNNVVYLGIISGIIASIIGALLFNIFAGGFEGTAEQIFEGIAMLIAAGMLTYMVLWMKKQRHVASELQHKISQKLDNKQRFGLFFLSFIAVLREGIETVLFLSAAKFIGSQNNVVGAFIGIILAIIIGYAMFVGSKKINIRKFFTVTTILLILFGAGLIAHSVHEFQEAGVVPVIKEHVWDVNPSVNNDGSFPVLHEKGAMGSIFAGLLGYNGNPSFLEVIIWFIYTISMFFVFYKK